MLTRTCALDSGASEYPIRELRDVGNQALALISPERARSPHDAPVVFSACLGLKFVRQAKAVHALGLKSYGVFTAAADGAPFEALDVWFFDPTHNRRNAEDHRRAFEAQGTHFRQHDDARFVVDAREMACAERAIGRVGQTIVAPFHSHRRQPPNFSDIDYRLHNPLFPWHLVISLSGTTIEIQPFRLEKGLDEFGIDATDAREDSECAYLGDTVRPLDLWLCGTDAELAGVVAEMSSVPIASPAPG